MCPLDQEVTESLENEVRRAFTEGRAPIWLLLSTPLHPLSSFPRLSALEMRQRINECMSEIPKPDE